MTRITIVIPTRERCETLFHTIQSCLSQDYDNFAVIVSDNVSTDATREVVHSFTDPRLKYIAPSHRLGMASHFNFAISHVSSGWVTSIGDDDAVLPGALRYIDSLAKEYPAQPISAGSVYYGWPQLPDKRLSNRLSFSGFGDHVVVRNSREVIRDRIAFRNVRERYVWGMAGVYRGVIPVELIRAGTRNGRYINSVTPDAYSAFATALLSPTYVHAERPLFVEGVSAKSNGAAQQILANADEERRYLAENDMPLHSGMTYCPAPAFVMIEAFLQVKAAFPEVAADLEPDFQAMCLNARLETVSSKMPIVQRAIDEIREKYNLPREPAYAARLAFLRRSVEFVRRAWIGLDVDGNIYGIRNVYEAAIVAGALWNYRLGVGHKRGISLLLDRVRGFLARRGMVRN